MLTAAHTEKPLTCADGRPLSHPAEGLEALEKRQAVAA